MKERVPYVLQYDVISALNKEINTLKETIKNQQLAVEGAAIVIDELREENKSLKKGVYTTKLDNEIGRLKQEVTRTTEAYIKLHERYELLMSKYIKE